MTFIRPTFARFALAVVLAWHSSHIARANTASLNEDGVLVIDGKKVFPIGFTTSPPPDGKTPAGRNAIEELADAGATFLRAGPLGDRWDESRFKAEKATEDAAAKNGLHCWLNLREASSIKNSKQEALLRKIVSTFKQHPGLGCYKGADEPEWGKEKLPPLERAWKVLKEMDPNHPLVIIEAPRGTPESLKRYNTVSDVVGFDVYPIGYPPGQHSQFVKSNSDITMVGDYTKRAVAIAGGKKAVWITLQIAWSGVLNPGKALRFPTFPEQRFMSYQAIINGARGLMFFGGAIPKAMTEEDRKLGWNWRFWSHVLRPVVEEIGSKSPLYAALLEPNSKVPVQVKGEGIEFCVRETGGQLFLLACKRNRSTEEVEFSGLPEIGERGDVLFEEPRKVEPKQGRFTDWFAPHDVHVYRFNRNVAGQFRKP